MYAEKRDKLDGVEIVVITGQSESNTGEKIYISDMIVSCILE